jgi:hypothetical protein
VPTRAPRSRCRTAEDSTRPMAQLTTAVKPNAARPDRQHEGFTPLVTRTARGERM